MRLQDWTVRVIKNAFMCSFKSGDQLWLFGSRVDDKKKGGDIDLYIQTQESNVEWVMKAQGDFWMALMRKLGEQRIDILVQRPDFELPIHKHARETGIQLV